VAQDSLKIYIDKALKLRFKSLCALQDRDMSQVAVELIEQWIRQQETSAADRSSQN
jgi:hypothetical protein